MMSGPWSAKQYVTAYLKWDLPRRLVDYRNLWQLDDSRLPTPTAFYPYEPPAVDHWPMVITVQMSTTRMERQDYTDGANPVYRCTYALRTYLWTREDSAERVTETRDRLTTVIRTSLLDRPSLNTGDPTAKLDLLVDETTMREEFSDITYVKGDRALAGSYISYDLSLYEAITRRDLFVATEESPMTVSADWFVLGR